MSVASLRKNSAFTLIELVVVIVVLAILSGVAIPKYLDYATKAKEAACKGTLGAARSAVANFYANQIVTTGTAAYPTLTDMQTTGTVMHDTMPNNPYNNSNTIAAAVYSTSNPPVSGAAGWNYEAATGKFWANSDTSGVDENAW